MFVGVHGVNRVVRRACELMKEHDTEDIKPFGGIPLAMLQKWINFWYSSSVDLFGAEKSTNAASYFASGLKGRAFETRKYTEHRCDTGDYALDVLAGDAITVENIPMRNAMNEILRDAYIEDNENAIQMWNRELDDHGMSHFRFSLPHRRFHRTVGQWAEARFDVAGNMLTEAEWDRRKHDWLPSEEDKRFVKSLMKPVTEVGKIAGWIAPPNKGINDRAFEYEYVKLA
jgi:benzoyl-CoA 2,3-dioxygenase component B